MPDDYQPAVLPSSTDHPLYDQIVAACREVYDPDIHMNIFDMGLIYTIKISAAADVDIKMSLTAPGCPVAGEMPIWVETAVRTVDGVGDIQVDLIWAPQWGLEMMSDEARLEFGFF